jgi:hypothetical protein
MRATGVALNLYSALAGSVLLLDALFILWVVFGAFLTRSPPKDVPLLCASTRVLQITLIILLGRLFPPVSGLN